MSLQVLYNKNGLLVLNKVAGVCSDQHENEQIMSMEARVKELFWRYKLAHRIDKQTTGILLFASQDMRIDRGSVYNWLRSNWQSNVQKEYLAIIPHPTWESMACDTPLPDGDGKIGPAVTSFRVVGRISNQHALVKCTLTKGGKKHQIRIHAKEKGVPLFGDYVYGGARSKLRNGQLLHAWKMGITFPFAKLNFQAPIPDDFKQFNFDWQSVDIGANKITCFD